MLQQTLTAVLPVTGSDGTDLLCFEQKQATFCEKTGRVRKRLLTHDRRRQTACATSLTESDWASSEQSWQSRCCCHRCCRCCCCC